MTMLPIPTRDRKPVMKEYPDHHDAELVLKIYDLRREATMRESRRAIITGFLPRTWEDVQAVMKPDHPLNAALRQVGSYWEMVYGMARHGIVHAEFLLDSNGEGLILLARMKPYLEQYRATGSPRAYVNAEWIATNTELGKAMFATFEARTAKALAAK